MSRGARAAKRDGRSVSCHNCDDRNGYPRHRPTKCPLTFRRFDGYQWDAPHEPVAKLQLTVAAPVVANTQPPLADATISPPQPPVVAGDGGLPCDAGEGTSMEPPAPQPQQGDSTQAYPLLACKVVGVNMAPQSAGRCALAQPMAALARAYATCPDPDPIAKKQERFRQLQPRPRRLQQCEDPGSRAKARTSRRRPSGSAPQLRPQPRAPRARVCHRARIKSSLGYMYMVRERVQRRR